MRFRAVHKLMTYLLAATAVATLMSSGAVPSATVALLLVAGTLSWFIEPGTRLGGLLDRSGLVFNIGALAFFGLSLFEVIRSFPEPDLTPVLNLVLFLLVYKLFHRKSNRDYLQVYVLSFLIIVAGSWLAQSVLFVVGFAVYVVLATWTLSLFHLRHEIEDNYLVKHSLETASEKVTAARVLNSRRVVGRGFFLATGAVALMVFLGAAAVFTAIPRIGMGFFTGGMRRRVNIVGFSDEVALGSHGVISGDNDAVVLRAKVPRVERLTTDEERDQVVSGLYWRGTVYDTYMLIDDPEQPGRVTGKWLRPRNERIRTVMPALWRENGSALHAVHDPQAREKLDARSIVRRGERQEIEVVGLSHPVAFALDRPLAFESNYEVGSHIRTEFRPRWAGEVALQLKRVVPFAAALERPVAEFSGARYVAYSRLDPPTPRSALPLAEVDPQQMATYLATPRSTSQNVRDLAIRLTAGKPGPGAKVQAVVEWLQKTHGYTTELQRNESIRDPLEDFLFHQKAGHCEYFAAAAAILLRLGGVPTRYVNGFLGGEWNDLAQHITVRDNRAHSWVEAYLGVFGWVRVDATPMGRTGSRMGRIRAVFDSVEAFWTRWVLEYDASRQIQIARNLGRHLGSTRRDRFGGFQPNWWIFVGVVLVAGAGVGVWKLRGVKLRRPGGRPRPKRGGPAVFVLYERTLDRLARRGWAKRPWETPRELVARLAKGGVPGTDAVATLTDLYSAARYGDREVGAAALEELRLSLDAIDGATPPKDESRRADAAA